MAKCKRNGCDNEGEDRAGYAGYCSLWCRDIGEADEEIARLREELEKAREELRLYRETQGCSKYPKT